MAEVMADSPFGVDGDEAAVPLSRLFFAADPSAGEEGRSSDVGRVRFGRPREELGAIITASVLLHTWYGVPND